MSAAIGIAVSASAATLSLWTLDTSRRITDGTIVTGTLSANVKVSIADGATVTLRNATINGVDDINYAWAGITCLGDATIILEGNNSVTGFYEDHSGIYVPEGHTLTITGEGSLAASGSADSNGDRWSAGIGAGYDISCGNIRIEGGTITATGGHYAAGIGGAGGRERCGDITITKGVTSVTAVKGPSTDYSIGRGDLGSVGTVTIGGVVGEITESPYTYVGTGAAGGTELPAPAFSAGGKAATTEFVQGANGKWTLTTFAEMSNDALGSDVANSQIKVYAANTVEGLESASPMTSGVEVKEKKSAVKTTIEVTPPNPSAPAQFFKVKFGE